MRNELGPSCEPVVYGRMMPATGCPPGTYADDGWPVRWVDGMRVLDGNGWTVIEPGEGVLVGLVPGEPRWWVDGGRIDRAFRVRGPIVVSDSDLVVARQFVRQTRPRASSRRRTR